MLAVTFTTRAAAELKQRLRLLGAPGVQARTFHAAALRQLSYFWPRVIGGDPPQVVESKLPLLIEAARRLRRNPERGELRDVASEIEWAKVTQVGPEDYPAAAVKARRTPPIAPEEVARLYEGYESVRRQRNLIDFETILELTAAVMTEHREVAAQIRQQYRYFVVDEFQDVNPLQKLLLDTWLGGRDDLCVVGDPNQTIYSFTGATPHYLTNFAVEHPSAAVIRLVRDYRSTPQVVTLANRVMARSPHRLELVAQRPDGPEPVFAEYDDEQAEALGVALTVKKLMADGVPTREIAVLFRINAQSEAYEQAFSDSGVPYLLRGADRFFERPEVRQAVVLLRGAARSAGDEPLAPAVHAILSGIGLTAEAPGGGKAREKWESLKALADLAEDMASEGADLPRFVGELERRAAEQHAPPVEGVTLASLHAAKGLEWDAVFLVGLTDGMVPIVYAETPDQVEEERRLLYVGVTRAREHLHLSWALARSPGGRRARKPSRFLDGLSPRTASVSRAERPGGGGRAGAPPRCRCTAGSAARRCPSRPSRSWAGARPARPTTTRRCSNGSRRGARRRRRRPRSPRTSSSRTSPCRPSRSGCPPPRRTCSRSRESGASNSTGTVTRSLGCAAATIVLPTSNSPACWRPPVNSALKELLDLLDLEQIELDIFRGRSPEERFQRVFGGQVAAQALVAAGRTVPGDRMVHSLHAYFIRPGDPALPIVYNVDRVRDGRSFTTRRITAIQHGKAIFSMSASFHVEEPGVTHQAARMPEAPAPETLPTFQERMRDVFGDEPGWRDLLSKPRPVDLRYVNALPWEAAKDPSLVTPENRVWFRYDADLPDDPLLHIVLAAYASDFTLVDTVLLAHGLAWGSSAVSGASLDHAMWFHRPFRADDWLLYAQESPWSGAARGLARGQMFTPSGELAVSVVQECLIRVSPEPHPRVTKS